MPSRLVEMTTASAMPKTAPSAVEMRRSRTNSPSGEASEPPSSTTNPASASASTAPVTSFRADSATTVCATFARMRRRSNSGMRMAGSVGARTAPMSSPASMGRSNASVATEPVISAVMRTPGTARSPRPTATGLRMLNARLRPP